METVLQHPEIINPYKLGGAIQKDNAYIKDLCLDDILASVPFYSTDSRRLAHTVMTCMPGDKDTAEYRLDVFSDMDINPDLRKGVSRCVERLVELRRKCQRFSAKETLPGGLELLADYRDIIMNPPDLSSAGSEALTGVSSYLRQIKESEEFSQLCAFLEKIGSMKAIDIRVSLDRKCSPVNMFIIGMTDKKSWRMPLLEKLLGKGRYEKTEEGKKSAFGLRNYGRLNALGNAVQEYMDEQFASVIRTYAPQVSNVARLLEPLDFYSGFSQYFAWLKENGFHVCRPVVLPKEERRMDVKNARNPVLIGAGETVVPNDIHHYPGKNMFIITAFNDSGKSVYVKTAGLIQLMGEKGLFVPAESAEISVTDGIYTHVIAKDDPIRGMGEHKADLGRIKEILYELATPYSMVILDDPGRRTSDENSREELPVFLDGFHRLACTLYCTTHLHSIAEEVDNGRYPAATNLSLECMEDETGIIYTRKVITDSSGKSRGDEIAKKLGLTPEKINETITKRAEEKGYRHLLRE